MIGGTGGSGRELSSPPADGISNLRFSNHSDHLLVSSWDNVRPNPRSGAGECTLRVLSAADGRGNAICGIVLLVVVFRP